MSRIHDPIFCKINNTWRPSIAFAKRDPSKIFDRVVIYSLKQILKFVNGLRKVETEVVNTKLP